MDNETVSPKEIGWWNRAGLLAGAESGAKELAKRDRQRLLFTSPPYGVTVVIARGERAKELEEWFEKE